MKLSAELKSHEFQKIIFMKEKIVWKKESTMIDQFNADSRHQFDGN